MNMLTNVKVAFVGFIIKVLYYKGFIIVKILEEANCKERRFPLCEVWTSEATKLSVHVVIHRK